MLYCPQKTCRKVSHCNKTIKVDICIAKSRITPMLSPYSPNPRKALLGPRFPILNYINVFRASKSFENGNTSSLIFEMHFKVTSKLCIIRSYRCLISVAGRVGTGRSKGQIDICLSQLGKRLSNKDASYYAGRAPWDRKATLGRHQEYLVNHIQSTVVKKKHTFTSPCPHKAFSLTLGNRY